VSDVPSVHRVRAEFVVWWNRHILCRRADAHNEPVYASWAGMYRRQFLAMTGEDIAPRRKPSK
jgi:hypothetical protein